MQSISIVPYSLVTIHTVLCFSNSWFILSITSSEVAFVSGQSIFLIKTFSVKLSNQLDNLQGYELVKEFTTTETNSTVEIFNYPELLSYKNGDNYFTEILVTAHFHSLTFGNLFAGAIKLATVPLNQNVGVTIYKIQADKFVVFDNSSDTLWRNHLLANIKGINITFKVFVLKITL